MGAQAPDSEAWSRLGLLLSCLLASLNVYSFPHKPGRAPFCTLLFVWEIPQILSKWPASLCCLSRALLLRG